jgi:hypothetical protein
VRIAVGHLKIVDDLAFVPNVISRGHRVDAEIEKLFRQGRRDSEASRGIFAVGDDEIDGVLFPQFGQAIFYDRASSAPKNVANEKNVQELRSQVLGLRSQGHAAYHQASAQTWMLSR